MQAGDARAKYLAEDQMRSGREDAEAYNSSWDSARVAENEARFAEPIKDFSIDKGMLLAWNEPMDDMARFLRGEPAIIRDHGWGTDGSGSPVPQGRLLSTNKDGTKIYAGEGGFSFVGQRNDTMYPVLAKPNWLDPAGLFYTFDANGQPFWRDGLTGEIMSPLAPYAMPTLDELQGRTGVNVYKAVSSGLGMVSDGLSIVSGSAMTLAGAGLVAAPDPTTLTKWVGVPLTVYGAAFTTKSVVGFGLNATNLYTALSGSATDADYVPGSALEWAVNASGGSPEDERLAVAADMAWGLVSGRVLDARLATGAVTNPRVASLLQAPRVTTVNTQALIHTPTLWKGVTYIEPMAGMVDLGPKVWDNIVVPLAKPGKK